MLASVPEEWVTPPTARDNSVNSTVRPQRLPVIIVRAVEHSIEQVAGHGIDQFADVVMDGDLGVGVAEQFRTQIDRGLPARDRGDAAPQVRTLSIMALSAFVDG
jgi:hypothetical protein